MYVKKPVINNHYDSQILIALGEEKLTIKQICDKTHSHKQTVRRQIKEDLLKEKYLDEEVADKRGKTVHAINWTRIVSDFLDYLVDLAKKKKIEKEEFKKIVEKTKIMSNNKFLVTIFKIMFRKYTIIYLKKEIPITLEDLFREIILQLGIELNPRKMRYEAKMKFEKDKEFKDFLDLTYLLETYFSSEGIPLEILFYKELENIN